MKYKIILLLLFLMLLGTGCAPYLMKAKMAQRDQRHELALEYALRHLEGHPGDSGSLAVIQKSARKYFLAKQAEIARLEQFENWDEVVALSAETEHTLSRLTRIPGLDFPTKFEMDFLKDKQAASNMRLVEALYAQGREFLNQGDYERALRRFTEIESKKTNFRDTAQLKSQAQVKLAGQIFQQAETEFNQQNYAAAIEQYERSLKLNPGIQGASEKIQQSKYALAQREYQQGRNLLQQKNYREAIRRFQQTNEYVANFEDSNIQMQRAVIELTRQLDREGEQAAEAGNYQQALNHYQEILKYQPENDAAREKLKTLQHKITVRLAVLPFAAQKMNFQFGQVAAEEITALLANQQSNYFMLLDRDHLKAVLEEQALAQTGIYDESKAVEVGRLVGVNHILAGKVTLVSSKITRPIRRKKTAYYKKNYLDPKGIKRTKKVPFDYTEYEKKRTVVVSLAYRLIDVETSRIVGHKAFTRTAEDAAKWVVCDKHRVNDLPGDAKRLLKGSKVPKAENELINLALHQTSGKVSSSLMQAVQSRFK